VTGGRPPAPKGFSAFVRAHKMWVIVPFLLVILALAALVLIASVPVVPFIYRVF
jgi:hypothetical protein